MKSGRISKSTARNIQDSGNNTKFRNGEKVQPLQTAAPLPNNLNTHSYLLQGLQDLLQVEVFGEASDESKGLSSTTLLDTDVNLRLNKHITLLIVVISEHV